jgi:hypothetical protein
MIPYGHLTGTYHDHGGRYIDVLEDQLHRLLQPLLFEVVVDKEWYLKVNEDVRLAVQAGHFASAEEHYRVAGYFENRFPRPVIVDEVWYLKTYPDVAQAIRAGTFKSAQEHFVISGFKEGRLPFRDWNLRFDKDEKIKKTGLC